MGATELDGRILEWDAQGRAIAITQGTQRSEFEYDGLSRRTIIRELDNGIVTSEKLYWWLGGTLVCERDGLQPGFPITKRYFGQGLVENGEKLFYTTDHLGSVRELSNENGDVVAEYRYSIYGERTKLSGAQDSDFGFAGLFHHEPSGLDLATYRLYDAENRRFISRDPLGESVDYNLYRYASNNPVNYVDHTGLNPFVLAGAAGIALGEYISGRLDDAEAARAANLKYPWGKEIKNIVLNAPSHIDRTELRKVLQFFQENYDDITDRQCWVAQERLYRRLNEEFPDLKTIRFRRGYVTGTGSDLGSTHVENPDNVVDLVGVYGRNGREIESSTGILLYGGSLPHGPSFHPLMTTTETALPNSNNSFLFTITGGHF